MEVLTVLQYKQEQSCMTSTQKANHWCWSKSSKARLREYNPTVNAQCSCKQQNQMKQQKRL